MLKDADWFPSFHMDQVEVAILDTAQSVSTSVTIGDVISISFVCLDNFLT